MKLSIQVNTKNHSFFGGFVGKMGTPEATPSRLSVIRLAAFFGTAGGGGIEDVRLRPYDRQTGNCTHIQSLAFKTALLFRITRRLCRNGPRNSFRFSGRVQIPGQVGRYSPQVSL